jgi:hypothetical protein
MSKLLDKLNQVSRAAPQPVGFRTSQVASTKPRLVLIASLAQADLDHPSDYMSGADAGILRVPKLNSAAKARQKLAEAVPDIPWGSWLTDSAPDATIPTSSIGGDFVVFPGATPLAIFQDEKIGKVLEVDPALTEGSLRAANELPIEAVLIAGEPGPFLTWQHLMLFQRLSNAVTKPLLVSIPAGITSAELQALWEAGVDAVVAQVEAGEPERIKGLRQLIDGIDYSSRRKRGRVEPSLPHISRGTNIPEEEEEEEDE